MTEEAPSAAAAIPTVHNGTYTVDHPERGHFTLKLYTVQKGELAGKRILSLLVGPDNESNYRGVAFWNDAPDPIAHVWKRFRGAANLRIDGYGWTHESHGEDGVGLSTTQKKLCIWADLAIRGTDEERHGYWYGSGYRILLEGRCVVCNRKLTDPDSIRLGIGPVCGGRS